MKAVGLLPALNAAVDATIVFSDAFTWDFDPTNGIDPTAIDFVGIATHEIGHALGFGSGVDLLDTNSPAGGVFLDDAALRPTALDLFRYSALSAASGVVDQAADSRAKYFSIDGGLTWIANFSTGQVHGDGRQAAHWKDSPSGIIPLGILDPTAAPGELQKITDLDRRAFDVIGWDVIPVPEPGMYGFVGAALLGGLVVLRRRRQV
jgi:MYXO-CTERM domain-containing protein